METVHPKQHPHGTKHRRYSYMQLKQMAIIIGFILITTLISLLLPFYFFNQGIAGG